MSMSDEICLFGARTKKLKINAMEHWTRNEARLNMELGRGLVQMAIQGLFLEIVCAIRILCNNV